MRARPAPELAVLREMPYSEACMHVRVAGKQMWVAPIYEDGVLNEHVVQLYRVVYRRTGRFAVYDPKTRKYLASSTYPALWSEDCFGVRRYTEAEFNQLADSWPYLAGCEKVELVQGPLMYSGPITYGEAGLYAPHHNSVPDWPHYWDGTGGRETALARSHRQPVGA